MIFQFVVSNHFSAEVRLIDVHYVVESAIENSTKDGTRLCSPERLYEGAVTGAVSAKSFSASNTFSNGCRRAMWTTGMTLVAPVLATPVSKTKVDSKLLRPTPS